MPLRPPTFIEVLKRSYDPGNTSVLGSFDSEQRELLKTQVNPSGTHQVDDARHLVVRRHEPQMTTPACFGLYGILRFEHDADRQRSEACHHGVSPDFTRRSAEIEKHRNHFL